MSWVSAFAIGFVEIRLQRFAQPLAFDPARLVIAIAAPSAPTWRCQKRWLRRLCNDRGITRSRECHATSQRGHRLQELRGRGARGCAGCVIGGNAINHPGRANCPHRSADEGILAGVVLIDLEVSSGVLH